MLSPAVFLDRDGVINHNRTNHVTSWAEFEFLPGVLGALHRLAQMDWPIVVVSNQAAIGRGLVSRDTVDDIHRRMMRMVQLAGGRIDDVLYCPHRPDEACACRKPRPGLLLSAADRLQLDLARSFLVGDAATDVLAAHAAGCRAVMVKTGRGLDQVNQLREWRVDQFYLAEDLNDAVDWFMRHAAGVEFGSMPQPIT